MSLTGAAAVALPTESNYLPRYFFRGFIFFLAARFAAALPLSVYGYFLLPTLGISQSFLNLP